MKLLKFSGLLLLTAIFSFLAHSAYAKEPVITKPNTGFKFGEQNINTATITEWYYGGECPGMREERTFTSVRFISESTPPASGLRVLVRNISKGFEGDPVPFSEKKYSGQGGAEDFNLEFSKRHNRKYLALSLESENLKNQPVSNVVDFLAERPGITNSFEYEIKHGSEVIETGAFTVTFGKWRRQGKSYKMRIPMRVSESLNRPFCVRPSFTKPGSCEEYSRPLQGTAQPGDIFGYQEKCVYTP
jgi:hypothetical protein